MTDEPTGGVPFSLVERGDGQYPSPAIQTNRLPPADLDDEGSGVDLKRYVAAVLRHKWMIIGLVLVGGVIGYFAMGMVKPEYNAQVTLWIEGSDSRSSRGTVDMAPMRSSQLLSSGAWIELLRSYVVLDPVVISERLYLHADRPQDRPLFDGLALKDRMIPGEYRLWADHQRNDYLLERRDGREVERGAFGDSVGTGIGLDWVPDFTMFPSDRAVVFTLSPPRDESVRLASELKTSMDKGGNFLRISLRGEDPAHTASILNTLAERHVEAAADLKRAKVDTLVATLLNQLQSAEVNLRNVETALEGYKVATATLPSDRSTPVAPGINMTTDPVFNRFFTMRVDLEQIRRDRDILLRAIQSGGPPVVEALMAVGPVQQSPELTAALGELTTARAQLRSLQATYTSEHPSVQDAAQEVARLENQTVPHLVRMLVSELETREAELDRTITAASGELRQIPPRAIEEARLQRQVGIAASLYTRLEANYQEARLAAAASLPDIQILDAATVPRRPVQDEKIMVLLAAVMASLGLGIGGAILRDLLDPRIRYPDEVSRRMGLNILGMVPRLPVKEREQGQYVQVHEAFRSIRLSVNHAFGAAGPITLTVSSPGPSEGKTFIAANLAVAFADQGHRVILVDGDIRRGSLHDLLGLDRKPGLTDFLEGDLERDQTIQSTRFERLSAITSGRRARRGPELIGSAGMRELLTGLRAEYDVIIVDSPPLGAGVDPFALSTMTGNLLLVIRSGTTDREMATSKLELVDRLPVRVLGAIMNDVPHGREYGYNYYSYSYVTGYEAIDEPREPVVTKPEEKTLQAKGVRG
jgi:succinoglycan biosynthesis transport protein ExoP